MGGSKRSSKARTTKKSQPKGVVDRRLGLNRRDIAAKEAAKMGEADGTSGLERRRGPGRRLSDFNKSAEEGEMTREQFMFLMAIDEFKKSNDKPYPTWTDVLEVIRLLGYRKTMASELNLNRAEDWHERADAPSNVRPDDWASRPVAPMGEKTRLRDAASGPTAEDLAEEEAELEKLDFNFEDLDEAA